MRTDDPRPRPARSDRLRAEAGRAWRRLSELGPRARVMAVALLVAAVAAIAYHAGTPSAEGTATAWLFDGQGLPPEHARRALAALAVAKVPATSGPRGQIAVPSARRADALAVLDKQKLLPPSLHAIRDEGATASVFDWPVDRGERREEVRQREAEVMIGDLDGIESADVRVHRATARVPSARVPKLAALVRIEPKDGRAPSRQTIDAIVAILKTTEPDLPADALTIMDRSGRPYVVAGNPEAGAAMMAQVREEELRSKILIDLNWIDGVRVLVALASPPAALTVSAPQVVLNGPNQVEPIPAPKPAPEALGRARILVQVPIGHYLTTYQALHRRSASLDDLKVYVPKVEETIRATVQNAVPASEIESLRIDRIDAAAVPPPFPSGSTTTIRVPSWLAPAAAVSAVVLVVMIGVFWNYAAKRPASRASVVPRSHIDLVSPSDSAPSSRVRDLVRRDPAAAAGVLGRWIGQGGATT